MSAMSGAGGAMGAAARFTGATSKPAARSVPSAPINQFLLCSQPLSKFFSFLQFTDNHVDGASSHTARPCVFLFPLTRQMVPTPLDACKAGPSRFLRRN
jgi:hypothetical protein